MADLIIRGVKMPETCGLCKLCLDDSRICNGYCMFFHRRVNMMERDKNCPLVPLPEGHGRLGDLETAEAILHNKTFDLAGTSAEYNALNWALRQIKALPTIVPAEGGTENDGNA